MSTRIRNVLLCGMLALSAAMAPAASQARTYVDVEIAPPPPRVEYAPPVRTGYVWVPGYWEWRGNHHVWVRGHWVRARVGYRWHHHRWYAHDGRWRFERGYWERDRGG